jgi:predicted ferric reductase
MKRVLLVMLPFAATGLALGLWGRGWAASAFPDPGSHGAWYASRAAGVTSYLFLWLGLAGGLAMSSAWFDGLIGRAKLLAIHQSASIAGVLLGFAHALVLIPDGWTSFGFVDVLVPFGSYYERITVAVGSLSLYLATVVTASFWFRRRLGPKAWKRLHYSSFAAWLGALYHGIAAGTDSREAWLIGIYVLTSLAVVFALAIRLTYVREVKRRPARGPASA